MATLCAFVMLCGAVSAEANPPIFEQSGYLSQYAQHIMPAAVEARIGWGQLPTAVYDYDVHIAVLDCELIGAAGTLTYDSGYVESVMVTDCSGHVTTSAWFERDNIIGEVDYATALRRGFAGRGGVRAILKLHR